MEHRELLLLYLLIIYIIVCTLNAEIYDLIGSNVTESDLFVMPNVELNFSAAQNYCTTYYYGLANIYDPNENNMILQLVNLNFISHAYIGYIKEESEWRWQSNISSNPLLWITSPLSDISTNIEDPTTKCMFTSRYGWQNLLIFTILNLGFCLYCSIS